MGHQDKQLNQTIFLLCAICITVGSWYFFIQRELNSNISSSSELLTKLEHSIIDHKRLKDRLGALETDFSNQNTKFLNLLKRIPSITDKTEAFEYFKNLLADNYFKLIKYSPYSNPMEEKKLILADTKDEVIIQKIAVDVELRGNFISFGQFIDKISKFPILINLSELELKSGKSEQVKFLAYLYFQSGNNDNSLVAYVHNMSQMIINENPSNLPAQNYIGGITTTPWKGEEVVVGIDNPQYTSEGIEIYSIEYSDGRKEFVERSKLPPDLFDDSEPNTEGTANNNTLQSKQEVLQIKTKFSDQLVQLDERIKSFKSDQNEQQKKHEQKLQKVEQEYKKQLDSIQDEFEKQLVRQEKKITAFEEQEKLKEELKKMDDSKLEQASKAKLESLQYEFDRQLRQLKRKITTFEAQQEQQKQEFDNQKRTTERQSRAKLESLQHEFEAQLQQQQEKVASFEALQVQQKKEKQNQEETNKENQRQLKEMQREFEAQLQQQQEKIAAFEAIQTQQQQEMAEKRVLAKQASKERLTEIQREFVDQLQKKENQITNIANQLAVNPAQKVPAEKQKPELTSAEKKAMQKTEMKEFMTTLKQLEAQEKKALREKLQSDNMINRIVVEPIKRTAPSPSPAKILPFGNLDHVFENMSIDGVYRFGNLEKQSDLIIITIGPQPIAQLKSGYWIEPGVWENTYRNLKNVRIKNDKFFSTEYIGEFVFYEERGELIKGLRIEKSGTGAMDSNSEVGKRMASIEEYYVGDYPYTSTRILSKLEIENMPSRSELKLMRNEIFARYGYKFEPNGRMNQHFSNKTWYQPQYEDVTAFLTDIEIQNVNQIKDTEVEVIEAINFLKGFVN